MLVRILIAKHEEVKEVVYNLGLDHDHELMSEDFYTTIIDALCSNCKVGIEQLDA